MSEKNVELILSHLVMTETSGIRALVTMRSKKRKPFLALVKDYNFEEEDARVTFERCIGTENFPDGEEKEEYTTYIKNIKSVGFLDEDYNKRIYIHKLIIRLNDDEDSENTVVGSESVSWKAHREAEEIDDPLYIPILKTIVRENDSLNEMKAAYFIFNSITKKLNDTKSADFIVDHLAETMKEDKFDNEALYYLMSSIYDNGMYFNSNIDEFVDLVDDEDDMIRNTSIRLLGRTLSYKEKAESALIEVLKNSYDDYGIRYAADSLYSVGSSNSIDALSFALEEAENEDAVESVKKALEKINNSLSDLV